MKVAEKGVCGYSEVCVKKEICLKRSYMVENSQLITSAGLGRNHDGSFLSERERNSITPCNSSGDA